MNNIEEIYLQLLKKYKNSKRIFILLNVFSLLLAATVIVLNIFAIRYNPVKTFHDAPSSNDSWGSNGQLIMWLFITLAIMSACTGFLTSFMSFFVWRKKAKKCKDKVESIRAEVEMHRAKEAAYQDNDRDDILIEKVTKIRNS